MGALLHDVSREIAQAEDITRVIERRRWSPGVDLFVSNDKVQGYGSLSFAVFGWFERAVTPLRRTMAAVGRHVGVFSPLQAALERLERRVAQERAERDPNLSGYLTGVQQRVTIRLLRTVRSRGLFSSETRCRLERAVSRMLGQTLSARAWNRMTFNEKVTYRRLCDRDPRLAIFSDKLRTREYVAERLGDDAVPAMIRVGKSAHDMADLVGPFALKPNHGSGWVVLVDSERTLTVDEQRRAQGWLEIDYGAEYQTWGYHLVEPKLLYAEELLQGGRAPDYKFFVFSGQVAAVQVDLDRFTGHRRVLMSPDWSLLGGLRFEPIDPPPPPPANLATMLEWASLLTTDVDFLRVDLYGVGDRVLVGELTAYPEAGRARFRPASLDVWMGSLWPSPPRFTA